MTAADKYFGNKAWRIVILLLVIGAGLYIRFDEYIGWKNEYGSSAGSALPPFDISADSYYYMDIADELLRGPVSKIDHKRMVPDGYVRPISAPLLSAVIASLVVLLNKPIDWVALYLPACLGILLAIPIYLISVKLFREASLPWSNNERKTSKIELELIGGICAFFTIMSPIYVARSSIGWCDTDSLNLFFPAFCIYFPMCMAFSKSNTKHFAYFVSWIISLLLFIWWWDQAPIPVLFFACCPLLVGLWFSRKLLKNNISPIVFTFALLLLFLGITKGWELFSLKHLLNTVHGLWNYITANEVGSIFPTTKQWVEEQKHSSYTLISTLIAGGSISFAFFVVGILVLPFVLRKYFLFILSFLVVSVFSPIAARFLIYTAPLFGLAVGAIVFIALKSSRKTYIGVTLSTGILLVIGWYTLTEAQRQGATVKSGNSQLYAGMKEISVITPENAVVWSSWSHGHPLKYYAKRGTIADGLYHPGNVMFFLNVPLASSDLRMSANWMQFYATHGSRGLTRVNTLITGDSANWAEGMPRIKEFFSGGVDETRRLLSLDRRFDPQKIEELLALLFPNTDLPLYLFLDFQSLEGSWYKLGVWDLAKQAAPKQSSLIVVSSIRQQTPSSFTGGSRVGRIQVDTLNGIGKADLLGSFFLSKFSIHDGRQAITRHYDGPERDYVFYAMKPGQFGILGKKEVGESTFVKLFFENKFDTGYFSPVMMNLPYYLLCKVTGDQYPH